MQLVIVIIFLVIQAAQVMPISQYSSYISRTLVHRCAVFVSVKGSYFLTQFLSSNKKKSRLMRWLYFAWVWICMCAYLVVVVTAVVIMIDLFAQNTVQQENRLFEMSCINITFKFSHKNVVVIEVHQCMQVTYL